MKLISKIILHYVEIAYINYIGFLNEQPEGLGTRMVKTFKRYDFANLSWLLFLIDNSKTTAIV